MEFAEVLRSNIMDLNMKAKNKLEAIEKLSDLLYKDEVISSKEEFVKDVLLREEEGVTGIGNYIAIPHGKSKSVKNTSVAMAKLINPIEWETLDEKPVKIIFLFAVSDEHKNKEHLKLLSQLASVLSYENSQEKLLKANNSDEVLEVFRSQKTHV